MEKVSQEMVDSAYNGICNNISDVIGEVESLQYSINEMKELVDNIAQIWDTDGGNDKRIKFNEIVQGLENYSQELITYANSLGSNDLLSLIIDDQSTTKTESVIQ